MDSPSSPPVDDEWDTEGFVIPSLGVDGPDHNEETPPAPAETARPSSSLKTLKNEEGIINPGPHGLSSQHKQIEPTPTGRKQKLKHKLKEADKRSSGTGRENKIENLRELVGVGAQNSTGNMPKSSPRDWLDPHCRETEFERRPSQ